MGISAVNQAPPAAETAPIAKKQAPVEKITSDPAPALKKDEAIISERAKDLAASAAGKAATEDLIETASARAREAQGV